MRWKCIIFPRISSRGPVVCRKAVWHPFEVWKTFYSKEQANKFRTDALAPSPALCFMHKRGLSAPAPLLFWPEETYVTSSLRCPVWKGPVGTAREHDINTFSPQTAHIKARVAWWHLSRYSPRVQTLENPLCNLNRLDLLSLAICHHHQSLTKPLRTHRSGWQSRGARRRIFSTVRLLSEEEITSACRLEIFVVFCMEIGCRNG